jgi:5,10-methylenetetrahydromethanopterin reductase
MPTFTASLGNHADPAAVAEAARRIDRDLAYDNLFVGDERLNHDTYSLLALAARNSSDIGLGPAVTNPYTRHPAMTAAAIATLDRISDGRAHLGFGGGSGIALDPLGYDQDDPVGTLSDAVGVVTRLLDGETVTLQRPEFSVDGADLDVTPVSDVPVYVAGRGPDMLGLGGFRGDGVLAGAGLASAEGMDYARERIAAGAETAGRAIDDVDIVCWAFLSVAHDRDAALDGVAPLVGRIVDKTPLPALEAIGIDPDLAERVKALEDIRSLSAAALREAIPREVTEQFAIAGTPADCREHVTALRDAGVEHFGLLAFDNEAGDELDSLERFSRGVIEELDA